MEWDNIRRILSSFLRHRQDVWVDSPSPYAIGLSASCGCGSEHLSMIGATRT